MAKLEKVYHQAVRDLEKINGDIHGLKDELKVLHGNYEAAITDRQRIQAEAEVMERRLIAADKLITGLGSEKIRYGNFSICADCFFVDKSVSTTYVFVQPDCFFFGGGGSLRVRSGPQKTPKRGIIGNCCMVTINQAEFFRVA